ncbi:FGGY family carbohydrate kinase [Paenibacillus sp. N1-5-1-14]|uniref:FGGY-family carbohydrate kinase n=1 Tax=Paenibacillus radicibacter TaxID=2972488 RepID=UPI002158D987|nr:FGGY family carbohydrate kinase [Paenibacillus radicibacter]MCR8645287.1 FGGY family carbohydrate kinase [Paenibacillus radicibacter]
MKLLGIDVGTTNIKAGLFAGNGSTIRIASRPTPTQQTSEGHYYYEPETLWRTVAEVIQEAAQAAKPSEISGIGITSMAEAGLVLDVQSDKPRSVIIPWFDTRTKDQAERIGRECDPLDRFAKSGLRASYKQGLAKLLWLREHEQVNLTNAKWLSMADYITYRLTGKMATDYTLAARTFAYRIDTKSWDVDWIRHFGLESDLFPDVVPAGTSIGTVKNELAAELGVHGSTTVAIGGHDHVCAALSVGAIHPGIVFDSMGTAETLIGVLPDRPLGKVEFDTGLSYGCHVAGGNRNFWMGGINASGGSVEWLRTKLADQELTYEQMAQLLSRTKLGPTGILYYPYLSGSGAPQSDPSAKAAFIGLAKQHDKGDMLKAVLEGLAYEMESIRRVAEKVAGETIDRVIAVGGGTRNLHLMQAKADVSGCTMVISNVSEAGLLGAAMIGGMGAGLFASTDEAVRHIGSEQSRLALDRVIEPNIQHHQQYQQIYQDGYMVLQKPLRQFYQQKLL